MSTNDQKQQIEHHAIRRKKKAFFDNQETIVKNLMGCYYTLDYFVQDGGTLKPIEDYLDELTEAGRLTKESFGALLQNVTYYEDLDIDIYRDGEDIVAMIYHDGIVTQDARGGSKSFAYVSKLFEMQKADLIEGKKWFGIIPRPLKTIESFSE